MRALLLLALLALPSGLAAQETLTIEAGRMNFGPVVTEEVENFVRMGQNDGMETYAAVSARRGWWYVRGQAAVTSLHVWSTADTVVASGPNEGKASDPRGSRFHYRVQGRARDTFVWSELEAGVTADWGPVTGRYGKGLALLGGTDHGVWGATPGPKPMIAASVTARWSRVGLTCRGSAIGVGEPFGRWSVLEHMAREVGDSSVRRTIKPLACGLSVTMAR